MYHIARRYRPLVAEARCENRREQVLLDSGGVADVSYRRGVYSQRSQETPHLLLPGRTHGKKAGNSQEQEAHTLLDDYRSFWRIYVGRVCLQSRVNDRGGEG